MSNVATSSDRLQQDVRSKIAAGVASLRAGKGVDGETFMAALDADLAEQERRGR